MPRMVLARVRSNKWAFHSMALKVEAHQVPVALLVAHHTQLRVIRVERILVSNMQWQASAWWLFKSFLAPASVSKKRNAPITPAQQPPPPIYGTLPHNVGRYQQNYDLSDIYNTNSTLPHPARNSMIENQRQSTNNINNNNNNNNSKGTAVNQQQPHFDNKVYERFEPYMMQQASKTSHKRSPSSDSISSRINLGKKCQFFAFFDANLCSFKLVQNLCCRLEVKFHNWSQLIWIVRD